MTVDVVTWVLVPKEMRKRPGAAATPSLSNEELIKPGCITYGTTAIDISSAELVDSNGGGSGSSGSNDDDGRCSIIPSTLFLLKIK